MQICLPKIGYTLENFIALRPEGSLAIDLQFLLVHPPFNQLEKRIETLHKLNRIVPVAFPPDRASKRPSIPLDSIADPAVITGVTGVLDEMLAEIQQYRRAP